MSSPSSVLMLISPFSPFASASHTRCGTPLRVTVSFSFMAAPSPGQWMRSDCSMISCHFLFLVLYFSSTLSMP